MALSVFELFSIGIGPSSSHTVGPMKATRMFCDALKREKMIEKTERVCIELYGSLGATGKAHGTEKAVILGLEGEKPETFDPTHTEQRIERVMREQSISLFGERDIPFKPDTDMIFHKRKQLKYHSNGMCCVATDANDDLLLKRTYYSVGGGFVVTEDAQGNRQIGEDRTKEHIKEHIKVPYPFDSAAELIRLSEKHRLAISDLEMENEKAWRSEKEVTAGLLKIWAVMQECVQNGIRNEGILPGGLKVKRRAKELYEDLTKKSAVDMISPGLQDMDWVNVYAIAVNEENAGGGRVVTAPTNGAAGIIPAVLHYYTNFCKGVDAAGIVRFFLAAGAIGSLYKKNASISGAEVGCQGEVGSACSMAAGGLAEAMGGSCHQVENAAEIAMEHNLGLTCDPVGGLVQIPCIERNAMGAVKAINAARMALRQDGTHFVSLDKVIKTMRETGEDMKDKYKETARGGLAVNVIEC